jgi:hypothetical protein
VERLRFVRNISKIGPALQCMYNDRECIEWLFCLTAANVIRGSRPTFFVCPDEFESVLPIYQLKEHCLSKSVLQSCRSYISNSKNRSDYWDSPFEYHLFVYLEEYMS